MDKVEITFTNGTVGVYPADNWGYCLKKEGISILDVQTVYSV
jgi:hypothetical protein